MAVLIAKECFLPQFRRFLVQLTDGFPEQTKHCKTFLRDQVDQLIRWEPRLTPDKKSWVCNEKGEVLEFRVVTATDDQLLYFMKYLCEQFSPYEEELLQLEINLDFFKHKENLLVKHMCLHSVWKVATSDQRKWIWEQLNILYLIAAVLNKLPKEVFGHFHKLLDRTTQGLLAGQETKVNIKALRDQAMDILKEVGEEKFTALMRYFFMLLQSPYSPIPELVPQNFRGYAKKFLTLLRSPKGIKLIRKGMNPFLKLAKNEFDIPLELPKEKELLGEDGKMDETKMTSAFKNIVERVLNADEKVWQNVLNNKDIVVEKVKGTWNSLRLPRERKELELDDDDSDDEGEEWVGIKKAKKEKKEEEEQDEDDDDDEDTPSIILDILSAMEEPTSSSDLPPSVNIDNKTK
jgi:hypothetical protein